MRKVFLCGALLATIVAGCGGDAPGNVSALVGSYGVMISSGGKSDSDEMSVQPASNGGVLLDFVYGISQIRCAVAGGGDLSIPRQVLHVSHSTGVADGYATGSGTIGSDGTVSIMLQLDSPGISPIDGGASGDGGSSVSYAITGAKQ